MMLGIRIAIGGAIFLTLALIDLHRNRSQARRWREYTFLLAVTAIAMAYGAINDQITSAISWEYFYYGKELSLVLGAQTPPDRGAMRWEAAKVGMKATWSVGLILGALLLFSNSVDRSKPQLPFRRLMILAISSLLCAVFFGIVLGFFGERGWLNWCSADFEMMAQTNLFRPSHFMTAWGVHLGGYLGGTIGGIVAVFKVLRGRHQASLNREVVSSSV